MVLFLGAPQLAQAAELEASSVPMERLLTDNAALSEWLETHHPEVAAAAARVEQADALVDQSHVIPNPTLSVAVGGLTLGERNPSTLAYGDTMNVSVGVSELVELGKRGPRARAAELRRNAARASARDTVAEKLSDARDAIARVVYVRERGRVLEERLKSARNVAALEQVRLEHGDISGIDHDRLELDADAAAREVAESQSDLASAIADCSTLLVGACSPGDFTMAVVDAAAPLPAALGDVGEKVRTRADVQAALLSSEAARSDATLYRRQAIPDPTFGLTYTKDYLVAAGNQANTLTASVSIPLPLFDHGQHLGRFADGQAQELGYQARTLETRALSDARALLAKRDVLAGKLDTLSRLAIPRADAVLKSSDDAYHHGQLSLTDLLIVRREHASLLLDAIDTRYELFTVRNTLQRTLGIGAPNTAPTLPASRQR